MELAPELAGFGLPAWRDRDVFVEECRSSIRTGLVGGCPEDLVFVALSGVGKPVGLAHVLLRFDLNTQREAVVINDLVVERESRGAGIGSLLMERCEEWAYENGAVTLVLAVFQTNSAARRFYERDGFDDDIVRVVRQLPDRSAERINPPDR